MKFILQYLIIYTFKYLYLNYPGSSMYILRLVVGSIKIRVMIELVP